MDSLKYKITHYGNTYDVYIERNVNNKFRTKKEARQFITKYKNTTHDNVLYLQNLFDQSETLKKVFYPMMDFRTKNNLLEYEKLFLDSHFMIYHNKGGFEQHSVQFNKIRVCFYAIFKILYVLKKFSQTHKIPILKYQLEPIFKMLNLVQESYTNDIHSLGIVKQHSYLKKENKNGIQYRKFRKKRKMRRISS